MEELEFLVERAEGRRLDAYLAEELPELSRSYVQKLIDAGAITVDSRIRKPSYKVRGGDVVVVELPEPETLVVEPEDLPISILYEDADVVVVDKAKGMVVHPAEGNTRHTLVNALLYHIKDLSGINGVIRPGIVHRIDKDTTGILVVAKNDAAHRRLSEQLKDHSMERRYLALVHGNVKADTGTIDAPLGRSRKERMKMAIVPEGKRAVTHYRVLRRYRGFTLVEARLETGRTHQIRVHMASIHHPLAGDFVYGRKQNGIQGQMLHAARLGFYVREGEYRSFRCPVHEDFKKLLMKLHAMEPR